ncbi:MAG: phosphoglycerate kinase [Candidatus Aminicenantes bacterium]|nr:phosphoglycerate kinase [Candidatus Aminicenantes bacterium]
MSTHTTMKDNPLLRRALENPPGNYLIVIGGTRVAEKAAYISKLLDKVQTVLIGGAAAYTFLAAKGFDVGSSPVEKESIETCRDILKKAAEKNVKLLLPIDHIAAIKIEPDITIKMIKEGEDIPDNMMGLDIGFDTIKLFAAEVEKAGLILWYGPLGVSRIDTFSGGTSEIAKAAAAYAAESIIVGEELAAAVEKLGLTERFSYISPASGPVLDFLCG